MWCNKVLVAYDGSAAAKKALEMVQGIIRPSIEIELVLVHIARLSMGDPAMMGSMNGAIADDAQRLHAELEEVAKSVPNPATVRVLAGTSPADLIVQCALEEGCDLIVMGSRGRGGVTGYLGSVSYAVIKESPVAVLIAKESE